MIQNKKTLADGKNMHACTQSIDHQADRWRLHWYGAGHRWVVQHNSSKPQTAGQSVVERPQRLHVNSSWHWANSCVDSGISATGQVSPKQKTNKLPCLVRTTE